jgi:multiphosphoryl transfer protein
VKAFKGTSLSIGFGHGILIDEPTELSGGSLSEDANSRELVICTRIPTVDTFIRMVSTGSAAGFIIPECSPYSHLAWAISYFDAHSIILEAPDLPREATAFVDFDEGTLLLPENIRETELLKSAEDRRQQQHSHIQMRASLPAVTKSGIRVAVMAQIQTPDDVALAKLNGADGVGETKSELILDRSGAVSLNAHSIIRTIEAKTDWRPIPLRFFDFASDKVVRGVQLIKAQTTLGYRGIRLLELDQSIIDSFLTMVENVDMTNVVTILPMVCLPSEVTRFRQLVGSRLSRIGVTLETPAAALLAEDFLDVVDYVEIGINDLTQFTMAWDRNIASPERLPTEKLGAPVAELISRVVNAASERHAFATLGIDLRPTSTLVDQLLTLGVRSVTVSPRLVPFWKELIRTSP